MMPVANSVGGLTNTDLTFSGSLKLAPVMENTYFIRSLIFDPSAGAFTLSSQGTEMLRIGSGGILNQSANTQTILSTLSLSNSQTWNVLAGDLNIQAGVSLGANIITIVGANDVTLAGLVQGSGRIVKQGGGDLLIGGASPNIYSGGTVLNDGTITLTKVNALGSGPLTITSGTLNLGSFNQAVGLFSMTGGTVSGTTGVLTASGYQVQSGTIGAQLGGSGSLIKSGGGVMTLATANTYSGGTIINGGTLAVNNLTGSGTGPGFVSINSGGTLIGRGSISGVITNRPGGTISPGAGIGQLSTGPQFWMGGSRFRWEIEDASSTAGVGWDLLNISGTLNVQGTAGNQITFDVASFTLAGNAGDAANFDPYQSYLWKMVQASGGITFMPGEDETTVFNLVTGGFANELDGGIFSLSLGNGGQDLYLVYTPVPEPDKLSLMGLAVCTYIYGRRFKRNWTS